MLVAFVLLFLHLLIRELYLPYESSDIKNPVVIQRYGCSSHLNSFNIDVLTTGLVLLGFTGAKYVTFARAVWRLYSTRRS